MSSIRMAACLAGAMAVGTAVGGAGVDSQESTSKTMEHDLAVVHALTERRVGPVDQPSSPEVYTVHISGMRGGQIEVRYPELPCSGVWSFLSATEFVAELREDITRGQDICVPIVYLTATLGPGGQLEVSYRLTPDGSEIASAILTRP